MEVVRHIQNTQNWKLVIFLQYLKKDVDNLIQSVEENKKLCIHKVTGDKLF